MADRNYRPYSIFYTTTRDTINAGFFPKDPIGHIRLTVNDVELFEGSDWFYKPGAVGGDCVFHATQPEDSWYKVWRETPVEDDHPALNHSQGTRYTESDRKLAAQQVIYGGQEMLDSLQNFEHVEVETQFQNYIEFPIVPEIQDNTWHNLSLGSFDGVREHDLSLQMLINKAFVSMVVHVGPLGTIEDPELMRQMANSVSHSSGTYFNWMMAEIPTFHFTPEATDKVTIGLEMNNFNFTTSEEDEEFTRILIRGLS